MKGMLSCTTLMKIVREGLLKVKEAPKRTPLIKLIDHLMSAYAVFSLKYASLLQFDGDMRDEVIGHNLRSVFGVTQVPSDTQMRERLDEVSPNELRGVFKRLFAQAQRSKFLEHFKYYDDAYLLPLDGTGFFYSDNVHCENCCEKKRSGGGVSYYHQMLSGAIVHPDQKVVLPFAPEPIMKSDGSKKNDCEHRAAERFLGHFKREHPHLKAIITGDGLYSDGPFIKRLKSDDHHFILVAQESNHKALFEEFRALPKLSVEIKKDKLIHRFSWANDIPINDSHLDCLVNVLEYWEEDPNKGITKHWVWVTDIRLNESNVFIIMRGGRARHKIENETFNTLKNQGYHFEHNFGHGNKNLSSVFANLMLLAFFVDQLQQLGCKVFKKALARLQTKKRLWERKRAIFFGLTIACLEDLWLALANGHRSELTPNTS